LIVMLPSSTVISSMRWSASRASMARPLSDCWRRMRIRWFSVSPKSAVSDPEKNPLARSSTGSSASIGMSTVVQPSMGN
jgi:hypothetical protein